MKITNNQAFSKIWIIIVVLIIIFANAILIYQYKEEKKIPKKITKEEITEGIYTNKKWGYKINTPLNWEKANELPQTSQEIWWISPRETLEKKYIGIIVKENPDNVSTPEFILGKDISCEYVDISYLLPRFCKLTKKSERTQEIIYATTVMPITGPEIVYAFVLRIDGGRQKINYYLPKKEIQQELDIFLQLLSTLEFISIQK